MRKKALFLIGLLIASTIVVTGPNNTTKAADNSGTEIGNLYMTEGPFGFMEYEEPLNYPLDSGEFLPNTTIEVNGTFLVTEMDEEALASDIDDPVGEPVELGLTKWNSTETTGYFWAGYYNPNSNWQRDYIDLNCDKAEDYENKYSITTGDTNGKYAGNITIPDYPWNQADSTWGNYQPRDLGIRFKVTINDVQDDLTNYYIWTTRNDNSFLAGGPDWTALPSLEEGSSFTVNDLEYTVDSMTDEGAIIEHNGSTIELDIANELNWQSERLDLNNDNTNDTFLSYNRDHEFHVWTNETKLENGLTTSTSAESIITIEENGTTNGIVLNEGDESTGFLAEKSNYVIVPQDSLEAERGSVSLDVKVAKSTATDIAGLVTIPGKEEIIYEGPIDQIGEEVDQLSIDPELNKVDTTVESSSWSVEKADLSAEAENYEVETGSLDDLYSSESYKFESLGFLGSIMPGDSVDWSSFFGVSN